MLQDGFVLVIAYISGECDVCDLHKHHLIDYYQEEEKELQKIVRFVAKIWGLCIAKNLKGILPPDAHTQDAQKEFEGKN